MVVTVFSQPHRTHGCCNPHCQLFKVLDVAVVPQTFLMSMARSGSPISNSVPAGAFSKAWVGQELPIFTALSALNSFFPKAPESKPKRKTFLGDSNGGSHSLLPIMPLFIEDQKSLSKGMRNGNQVIHYHVCYLSYIWKHC